MSSKKKTIATKDDGKPALVPKLRFPEFRGADVWESTRLGDLCEVITKGSTPTSYGFDYVDSGVRFVKIESLSGGSVDCSKTAYITEDCNTSFLRSQLKENDILFSIAGALGVIALIDRSILPANVNQAIGIVRLKQGYSHQFLLHQLQGDLIQTEIQRIRAGAAQPNISLSQLGDFAALLPTKAEQQKIAECLSSVAEVIAAQARKVVALKTHKKGLMQQLFPLERETQPRLRFPEFRKAGKWAEDTLDNITTFRRGSFPQPYGLPEWYDEKNGMPFIQVFDVGDDFQLKDKTKSRISKLGAEKSVFIPEGTLIVTLQGSIGRVAITHYDAYIDRTLLIFESFQKPIEKVFFARVIQNLFDIEKEKAPGGIIKTITKEALSDFKVKYPTIEEQQRIASCLSSLDALITAETQKLEALKRHKRGLMQQLFPSPGDAEI